MLSGIFSSYGLVIVDERVFFGCHENMFTGRFLVMDEFSGPSIPAFICHVKIILHTRLVIVPKFEICNGIQFFIFKC
jgi:hypothetical protein